MRIITVLSWVFLFSFGCSPSSKVLSSWKLPAEETKDYKKIMVMAIFPNMQVRATVEEAMVRQLANYGIKSTVSYDYFPLAARQDEILAMAKDTAVVRQVKENMRRRIIEKGVEGLFMISLFDVEKDQQYHEENVMVVGPAYGYYPSYYGATPVNYYGSYYDYYAYNVGTVHSEGYYTTNTTFYIQTNLFDVPSDRLIYAVQGSTVDYHDIEGEANDLGRKVVKDIAMREILAVPDSVKQKHHIKPKQ